MKDIYGVYAEPVDPEELPDYHDIIEHPMDFATVRSKLGNGSYATLEQFESDVFLICSNTMQYNSSETVYYKQVRTIQELAKRKLEKVRLSVERTEKEIKSEQKSGSVLKKQIKRFLSRTPQEPVGSDFSSGATLVNAGDNQNLANAFQAVGSEKPGNIIDGLIANSFLNDYNLEKAEDSFPARHCRCWPFTPELVAATADLFLHSCSPSLLTFHRQPIAALILILTHSRRHPSTLGTKGEPQ